MATTTTIYGWPVPELTDSPNAPQQFSDLADAVEATVNPTTTISTGPTGNVDVLGNVWTTIATVTITLPVDQSVQIVGWAHFTGTGSGRPMVALQVVDGSTHLFGTGQTHFGGTGDTFGEEFSFSTPRRSVGLTAGTHTLNLQAYKDGAGSAHTNRADTYASQGLVATGIEATY